MTRLATRLFPDSTRVVLQTLLLGTAGGFLMNLAGIPAGWLCGAMIATAIAALRGLRTKVPDRLRDLIFIILGTSMGSSLSPDTLNQLKLWPFSVVILLLSVLVSMYAGSLYLQRLYGWDKATARLSSVPGALSAVLAIASGTSANMPAVALSQTLRQLVLVSLVPLVLLIGPYTASHPAQPHTATLIDAALMLCAGAVGSSLLALLKIPGAKLLGAMIASGLLHALGWVDGRLDPLIMTMAFIVTGAVIGSRLSGHRVADLLPVIRPALGSVFAAIAVAIVFALICHMVLGLPFVEIWLAYAPGGVEAMTIMTFALNLDPSYVSTHHVIRLFFLMLTSPLWTMGFLPRQKPGSPAS